VYWLPVSSARKNPPHRIGLPDAVVFGGDQALVEATGDLASRQPTGPVLWHHSDRGLLGAVFHELVVQAVEAKRELAGVRAPVPVLRDAESVQGFKDPRMARVGEPSDLPDRKVSLGIEPLKV